MLKCEFLLKIIDCLTIQTSFWHVQIIGLKSNMKENWISQTKQKKPFENKISKLCLIILVFIALVF